MHELPIAQSVLDIALRYAEREAATRITTLHLLIGELSSIVDDTLQFYWDIISRDTIAEGAILNFQRVSMLLVCNDCHAEYEPARGTLNCAHCHSDNVRVVDGDAFRLESIDIEQDERIPQDR